MKTKNVLFLMIVFLIGAALMANCSPSAATPEATKPVPQATFTPAPTFTSTPIPYELEVQLVTEDGMPMQGAKATIKELGSEDGATVLSNDEGKVSWSGLSEETAMLSIFAQGYLPVEEEIAMTRGNNQAVVTLVADPKGLQVSDVLEDGETLLYIEDFQDSDEDFPGIKGVWSIIEDPDNTGNLVIDINHTDQEERASFDTPIEIGVTNFTVTFNMRFLDIDHQIDSWTDFYFRDYAFSTFISPYARSVLLLDFNQGGDWLFPVTTNKNFNDGEWYSFRLDAYDNEINFFVNDSQLGRFKDAKTLNPTREENKYLSFAVAPGSHVQFDDIVIKLATE